MSRLTALMEATRKAKGHSQTRAAATLGVTQSYWSRLKHGFEEPGEDRWPALAAYMGMDVAELSELVAEARAERLARNDPNAAIAAEVIRLRADVDALHGAVSEVRGAVDLLAGLLRAPRTEDDPGKPSGRPSGRRSR